MGVWSYYLYTTHPDLEIDVSAIPENVKSKLWNHGLDFDTETGTKKLDDILSPMSDCAKIYGYLDSVAPNWEIFLKTIYLQYPNEHVEIYLFCIDNDFPYRFTYKEELDCLHMETFLPEHVAYFDLCEDDGDTEEDIPRPHFNTERFKKHIQTCEKYGCFYTIKDHWNYDPKKDIFSRYLM